MDNTQLQEQIQKHFGMLSPKAQQAFSSMAWMETLQSIATTNSLDQKQIETLGVETSLFLLGVIPYEEFETNLKIEIPEGKREAIMKEILEKIVNDIRPDLEEAFTSNVKALIEEKYGDENKLDERFAKLPEEVKSAIQESGYQEALYEIAEKNKLSISEMGALDEVTTKVMIGMIHPEMYEHDLKEKSGLPSEKVAEIAKEVNERVLKNIRLILREHFEKNNKVETEDDVPIPPYASNPIAEEAKKLSDVFKEHGIDINTKDDGNGVRDDVQISNKEETGKPKVLPTEIEKNDIFLDKLTKATSSSNTVTDYSLPKMGINKPSEAVKTKPDGASTKQHDPYREEI